MSPSEAWKTEIDLENEIVRSKYNGLCRARRAASARSSRLRSAVACGSAASSWAYTSAAVRPRPRRPAQLGAVRCLPLAEQQVIRLPLHDLALLEAQRS